MAVTERCRAIVLERTAAKEYDRWYTLFTRERGLVHARARGASKPKAKVRPHVEGFGVVDVMLVHGRAGLLLASAEMLAPVRMRTVEAHSLAMAAQRVLARALREHDPDEQLFGFVANFLESLPSAQNMVAREVHFFWNLLGVLGYNGAGEICTDCGGALAETGRFVPFAGAFYCDACARGAGVLVPQWLRDFLREEWREPQVAGLELLAFRGALADHFGQRLDFAYPRLALGASA